MSCRAMDVAVESTPVPLPGGSASRAADNNLSAARVCESYEVHRRFTLGYQCLAGGENNHRAGAPAPRQQLRRL